MISVSDFWNSVMVAKKDSWLQIVEFMLNQFGTALHCNRFAVGEVIEYASRDLLGGLGVDVKCIPSAARIDMEVCNIEGITGISSKFVSTKGSDSKSHVVLHNSQRTAATDTTLHPTLLFLMDEWWFLDPKLIKSLGIDVNQYIKNTSDSVHLKFTILDELRKKNYPYCLKQSISYNKEKCPRKATSELTYLILKDYLNPDTDETIRTYLKSLLMERLQKRASQ